MGVQQQKSENGQNGYIKHSETNGTLENQHFVERVSSIPLIKEGVSTAQTLANKTRLGRFALSTANSTLTSVAEYASKNQPKYLQTYYESYLQPQVQKADAFGCRSLDLIQTKVPIINKPSADIIHAVTQPSYEIIDGVKVRIDSTLQTVTHPAHVAVQEANKRFGYVVDHFEGAVDKYLPPSTTANGVHDEEKSGNNQVKRAYSVLTVASYRIHQKVTNGVSRTLPNDISSHLGWVQDISNKLKFAQDTLVQSFTVYGTAALDRLPPSVAANVQKTIESLSHMTEAIHQQLGHLVNNLSPVLKQHVQATIESIQQQISQIRTDLARKDVKPLEKLKLISTHLQQNIQPLLENISSQITHYLQLVKSQAEASAPLHYLDVTQKVKTQ